MSSEEVHLARRIPPRRGCLPQHEHDAFRKWSPEFQSYLGWRDLSEDCPPQTSNSFLSLRLLRPVPTRARGNLDRWWTVQIPRSGSSERGRQSDFPQPSKRWKFRV